MVLYPGGENQTTPLRSLPSLLRVGAANIAEFLAGSKSSVRAFVVEVGGDHSFSAETTDWVKAC